LSNRFNQISLPHDELPPSCPKQTIANQKLMMTVAWNPHGFHVIQSLPEGSKWTGRYYSDTILYQIAAFPAWEIIEKRLSMPITPVRMLQNVSRTTGCPAFSVVLSPGIE
jgi:hypothetical protein